MEILGAESTSSRRVAARAMTRCECAGVPFEDVAQHLEQHGLELDDVFRKTGCGQTCTACLPDLRSFLARRPETAA